MLAFEAARAAILDKVPPAAAVLLPLAEAAGKVLAEDVVAACALPRWDNSAMDGYAVRHDDCSAGAWLAVTGFLQAGGAAQDPVAPGCAIKIMTGAPVPAGADTVVPVEEAEEVDGRVRFAGPVSRGAHIRVTGEDVAAGERVVPAGKLLRAAEVSLLATLGVARVPVYRPVRVAILSTGDELVATAAELAPGKIIDSNTPALAAAVREAGAEPVLLGFAGDDAGSLRAQLARGLEHDVLITSAGVSAGDLDLVRDVLRDLEVEPVFWKVAIKPGKPTAFGLRKRTPVFSLPGNPVSALMTFEQFVRPALLKMMGHRQVLRPLLPAQLKEPLGKKPGRTLFLRVSLSVEEGRLCARSAGDQHTGILKTLVDADAIAVLPAELGDLPAGETVRVSLLDDRACPDILSRAADGAE